MSRTTAFVSARNAAGEVVLFFFNFHSSVFITRTIRLLSTFFYVNSLETTLDLSAARVHGRLELVSESTARPAMKIIHFFFLRLRPDPWRFYTAFYLINCFNREEMSFWFITRLRRCKCWACFGALGKKFVINAAMKVCWGKKFSLLPY